MTQALENATLVVEAGEVHGLVGANGAGKSTLVKILSGAERADSGSIRIGGWSGHSLSPHRAQELGLATIYQDPSLAPTLTLVENVVLGREATTGGVFLSRRRDREAARTALDQVGLGRWGRRAESLNPAEQQLLEVAKALYRDAKIIIMDEPTAALGSSESNRLFGVIESLRSSGVATVFISHRLDEVLRICGRVTVMRDGKTVHASATEGLTEDDLVRAMIGHSVGGSDFDPAEPGSTVLETRGMGSGTLLQGIDLTLRGGEVVGLTGLVGSGRSRLVRVLFGAEPYDQGEVLLEGKPFRPRSPATAIRRGIGLVPEDRKRDCLFLEMSAASNVTMVRLPVVAGGFLQLRRERRIASAWLERVQLRPLSTRVKPSQLSGGNQQKVAVARWLNAKARVLIFDEPGQGVDIGAKEEMFKLLRQLAAEGHAVLVVSQEVDELLQVADRVLVMRRGTIAGELTRDETTEESVLALALGSSQTRMAS